MTQQPPYPPAVPPPSPADSWQAERVEAVPGTEFGLVQLRVEPITSGLAVGSMLAGIASILVALVVFCFGILGAQAGWGAQAAGAFTVLSLLGGGGAIVVGLVARRQIRRPVRPGQVRFTGRGLAIAGISCGAVGAGIAAVSMVLALILQLSS